jgi:hypothetical protein
MSTTFMPYLESESPSIPSSTDAYIPVRVTEAPLPDGSMRVYLPDGTAFFVNSKHLLRLDPDPTGGPERRATETS